MGKKKMANITTVKVNPYEIAKASDMEFGFKNVLANTAIVINQFFAHHSLAITDEIFNNPHNAGNDIKDFIIGGGLVSAGKNMLRPLPMAAFSKTGGLFITNGRDVEDKDIQIEIGTNFYQKGYRIESIYIGNAWTEQEDFGSGNKWRKKKDFNWDEFASEWRASYKISSSSDVDTTFSEFKKRQMQAVRFFVHPGIITDNENDTQAVDTSNDEAFKDRVKIAEVLVRCKLDSGNFPIVQPIRKSDIRFVSAVQYWGGKTGKPLVPDDPDNTTETAVGIDRIWVQKVSTVQANTAGMDYEQAEQERYRAEKQTEENKAFRAEHYNYRWTAEHTRTYRLYSVAEMNERFYTMHKSDGDIKEKVIRNEHIILENNNENAIHGGNIYVGNMHGNAFYSQPISLPYEPHSIVFTNTIKEAFLAVAQALQKGKDHINEVDRRLTNKIEAAERRLDDKINNVERRLDDKIDHIRLEFDQKIASLLIIIENLKIGGGGGPGNAEEYKVITTQSEFDAWVDSEDDDEYKGVKLRGTFTLTKQLDLSVIGTKVVVADGKALINGTMLGDFAGGIVYLGGAIMNGVEVEVSGKSTNLDGGQIVAVSDGVCINCSIKAIGDGSGFTLNNGMTAIAAADCTLENCSLVAIGEDGSNGVGFVDGTEAFFKYRRGASGWHGGHALTAQRCSIRGKLTYEKAQGGKGGNGGVGESRGFACMGSTEGGDGGNGGNGGDAHVLNVAARVECIGGRGGNGGKGGEGCSGGSSYRGKPGKPGKNGAERYG